MTRRLSYLDSATAVVLSLAVLLAVRPAGPLRATVEQWRATRRAAQSTRSVWPALVSVAEPLYQASGPPDIIEFSDYECPFCRSAQVVVDSALDRGLRIAVIHLPLRVHRRARPAALGAICAAQIGHFSEAHQFLMSNDGWALDTGWAVVPESIARFPVGALTDCERSGAAERVLREHLAMAESAQVRATPTFLSANGALDGPPSVARLAALVTRR